jgi:hypothetical protein
MANAEVLAEIVMRRGYVVFRFENRDRFRRGEIIKRFKGGTPLPQPFLLVAKTDTADWKEQCELIESKFGHIEDVRHAERFTFFRCITD